MSDSFRHNGKVLGHIHSYTGNGTNQFDLVMEGIDALEYLFRLGEKEILHIDGGIGEVPYSWFRENILGRAHRIYPISLGYVRDRFVGPRDVPIKDTETDFAIPD
ncbi:MAG: hypothetical protein HYW26_03305 [Candidatus Aenigmarchaeota archaeon]|nr:hypothetical protein [Candidatus Aenigmarchaeota archaeon]